MSNFRALNVESDNESEDEVDNTKEIQIEEALKLYQTALKHHAEGPQSFEQAAEAYKALFESEIFKYHESLSEYRRHELYGDSLVFDSILQEDYDAGPVQLTGGNESAPNTLPQILHLSYKNHGQFMLEMMQHWVRQHRAPPLQHGSSQILGALTYFSEALDKEDNDLDLWLRTASVAALLGSRRVTRFCLEAVLDGDDELVDSVLRLPGLEEGFAGQQLRELVDKLEDSLSLMQAPLSSMRRKKLSDALKKRLNPYPSFPLPSEVANASTLASAAKSPEHIVLNPSKWDWAGIGEVILHHFHAEQGGFVDTPPGSCINITLPPDAATDNEPKSAHSGTDGTVVPSKEVSFSRDREPILPTSKDRDGSDTAKPDEQDVIMVVPDNDKLAIAKKEDVGSSTPQDTTTTQSRKRSTDSAGLPETADGGRVRSKRLRARESFTDSMPIESAAPDLAKQLEDQLYAFIHADKCLFEIVNDSLEKLGVPGLGSPEDLRKLLTNPDASATDNIDKAACDMFAAIQSGAQKVAAVLLTHEPVDLGGATREAGLNAFLGNAKSSISQTCKKPVLGAEQSQQFIQQINGGWLSLKEVAFEWLEMLLSSRVLAQTSKSAQRNRSTYMEYRWAEDLKRHLVQIIVNFDDYVHEQALDRIAEVNAKLLRHRAQAEDYQLSPWDQSQIEMVETLFELHLDIYSLIKHPHSGVDLVTQTLQGDRMDRWAALARTVMQLRSDCGLNTSLDELALRHIWASVFQMNVNDDIPPEHVIFALNELKDIFESTGTHVIEVQNNAVMPELSVAAIDRELTRISMKDFFLRVFDQDEKDPAAVIESLEPILEPADDSVQHIDSGPSAHNDDHVDAQSSSRLSHLPVTRSETQLSLTPHQEMRKFLDTASTPLKLSLWQRLREAYEAIEYPPKVLCCYLRTLEILIAEFKAPTYRDCPSQDRQFKILSKFRVIDEVLVKILQIIRGEKTAFDCLPFEHLQSSMAAMSELLRIMSAVNMFEDLLRVGHFTTPRFEGVPNGTFLMMTAKLHDMQLRAWILQYHLLKEGITQSRESFPTPSEDQFEFLRHVHYATGVRGFCHLAGRLFLRLAKDEVLRLNDVIDGQNRDTELAQILYDLYGLKMFDQPLDCHDFGTVPEVLDKKTALQLLPFIMSQARKIPIRDLPKTDLKVTIDKVHGSLGRPKTNEDISLNRKVLTAYFKSPINPLSLFDCIKGVGALSTKRIPDQAAVAASKGWYFLMGNIALNKFRSQKRLTPGPTEDLNFAQAFFMQDLEFAVEPWETWYRLAQANDAQLEESVSWNADKINNNSVELIHFQRAAIHCYIMAVACAVRDADASADTLSKVSEMYTNFGNRIYSSTREPFSMSAFNIRESEQKYYSGLVSQQVYQNVPFAPMHMYTAWKFASVLFRRAIQSNPDKWWNYYMLAKCLWKMHCANADAARDAVARGEPPQPQRSPSWEDAIDAIISAIEVLPERKGSHQPILEPHYKLVSVVHKLFHRKVIDHKRGKELLDHTAYSQGVVLPENADDWERYILAILKALRVADKQGWHHRIIARSAHVIYDDSKEPMVAFAAKHELTERIFTKTMAVQVWKPENERPGRHFVYTSRYTRFFVSLLVQTGDKVNLEMLAKRVRRKTTDFFEHSKLWQDLCLSYLKLLRRSGKIPDGHEDAVFKAINNDEFQTRAARMEAWCQSATTQNRVLDVLRDVIELKRLNNGLMKALLIDDLIGDTYALLYETVGSALEPLPSEQPKPSPFGVPPPLIQPVISAMPTTLMTQMQVDGATDPPKSNTPFAIYHPGQLQEPLQPPQPDTTARTRAKAVGRREIQRKAESCVAKPPATLALPTAIPIRSPPMDAQPLSSIPLRVSPEKPPIKAAPTHSDETLQVVNSGTATAGTSISNAENSAPASVHDDADDESELSELDESEVQEMKEEAGDGVHDPEEEPEPTPKPSLFPHSGIVTINQVQGTADSSAGRSRSGSNSRSPEYNTAEER